VIRTHEDKMHGTATIETKEEEAKVDAVLVCPERDQHRNRLNQACGGCGAVILGGGSYSPAEFDRYFRMGPDVSEPAHRHPFSEAEAQGWREYEELNNQLTAAVFRVEDLRISRGQLSGRYVDRSGNTQIDTSIFQRGAQADEQIASAIARREQLREQARQKLLEVGRLSQARTARIRADLYAESFPEPAPSRGVVERIGDAVRGS